MQRFLIKQTSFVEKGIEYVKLLLLNMIAFIVSTVILKLDKMVLYSMWFADNFDMNFIAFCMTNMVRLTVY